MTLSPRSLVVFSIEDRQFALPVEVVERVHRCVEIAPLPEAPAGVRGVINVRGTILPVYDLREQIGAAAREPRASDHLLIAHTTWRMIALLVDSVTSVVPFDASTITSSESILPGLQLIPNVLTLGSDIVLVHDLDFFLSKDGRDALQLALEKQA